MSGEQVIDDFEWTCSLMAKVSSTCGAYYYYLIYDVFSHTFIQITFCILSVSRPRNEISPVGSVKLWKMNNLLCKTCSGTLWTPVKDVSGIWSCLKMDTKRVKSSVFQHWQPPCGKHHVWFRGGVNQSRNTVVCVFQGEIYATQRDSSATVHPRAVWQIRLPFLFSTGTMITRSRSWAKLCVTCIKTFHFARAPGRFSPEATFLCVYLVFLRTIKVSERCADHVKGWSNVCARWKPKCQSWKSLPRRHVGIEMPPKTCAGFVPLARIRHSELRTLNSAVMLLRLKSTVANPLAGGSTCVMQCDMMDFANVSRST